MRRRRYLSSAVAGIALPTLAGCIGELETTSESLTIDAIEPGLALRVSNRNGDVSVEGADRDDGDLQLTKRTRRGVDLDRVSVAVTARNDRVELEPEIPADIDPGHVTLHFHLTVPETIPNAAIATHNGTVQARNLAGNLALSSVNGDVQARDVDGTVSARTTNGDVTVRDCAGIGDLRNTNGDIRADVRDVPGDVVVETTNGDVGLAIDPTVDCELDVRVTNGDIDARGLDLQTNTVGGGALSGTLGDGGPVLTVETTNGSVELDSL